MIIVFLSGTLSSTTPPRLMRCQWMVSLYIPFVILCCYMKFVVLQRILHTFSCSCWPHLDWHHHCGHLEHFQDFFSKSSSPTNVYRTPEFCPTVFSFCISGMFWGFFLPKGGINEGTIGVLMPGPWAPPSGSLRCVHPSTACKPDPRLEAGSGCKESGSKYAFVSQWNLETF